MDRAGLACAAGVICAGGAGGAGGEGLLAIKNYSVLETIMIDDRAPLLQL